MKKVISIAIIILMFVGLCDCGGTRRCKVFNGSGYYQKKTCVFCNGSGYSDYDPYEHYNNIGK